MENEVESKKEKKIDYKKKKIEYERRARRQRNVGTLKSNEKNQLIENNNDEIRGRKRKFKGNES